MVTKNYTTKTAALKATKADINKLEAKKLKVNGKDVILSAKHDNDTRETVTEDDLWGQYTEIKDGQVIVHDDYVINPWGNRAWITSVNKVEKNKAYVNDTFCANIQTEKIKNGRYMFLACSNFTSFSSDLSSLTNGKQMFENCSNFTTFESNLSSLTNGEMMFSGCSALTTFTSQFLNSPIELRSLIRGYRMFKGCSNLEKFSFDLNSLTNGYEMFNNCSNLVTFIGDLSSLTNGNGMFSGCSNLEPFTPNLSSLTNGESMFKNCSKLTEFTSDLSSLTNGPYMFNNCTNLTAFDSDLSSLVDGNDMFNNCTNLTSFTSDLSSLTEGYRMFYDCSALTAFTSDLSSLVDGVDMFSGTKLSPQSVMYIAESINDDIIPEKKPYQDGIIPYVTMDTTSFPFKYSASKGFMSDGTYVYTYNNLQPFTTSITAANVGKLTIGINVTNDSTTIADQLQAFAEEATFDSWADLKQTFVDKGWTVTWQYGGTNTSITYNMGDEKTIPCPIYAQLVEVEDKDHAEYTNEDGSKFYSIIWGHDVSNYDDFQQFDSLEDAMTSWNVFPKENIISTEE